MTKAFYFKFEGDAGDASVYHDIAVVADDEEGAYEELYRILAGKGVSLELIPELYSFSHEIKVHSG